MVPRLIWTLWNPSLRSGSWTWPGWTLLNSANFLNSLSYWDRWCCVCCCCCCCCCCFCCYYCCCCCYYCCCYLKCYRISRVEWTRPRSHLFCLRINTFLTEKVHFRSTSASLSDTITRALIGQNPMFYQSIKHRKSVFCCFAPVKSRNDFVSAARVFYISLVFSNARRVL